MEKIIQFFSTLTVNIEVILHIVDLTHLQGTQVLLNIIHFINFALTQTRANLFTQLIHAFAFQDNEGKHSRTLKKLLPCKKLWKKKLSLFTEICRVRDGIFSLALSICICNLNSKCTSGSHSWGGLFLNSFNAMGW